MPNLQILFKSIKHTAALLLPLLILGCTSETGNDFQDPESIELFRILPPKKTNVIFENHLIENEQINIIKNIYYYNGSGVAVGDINNDGRPDIYFAATTGKNKLFLNLGNLKFHDISLPANVEGSIGLTTGVSFVDINNDGFLDIYVCKTGTQIPTYRINQLFINDGNLRFTEQAKEYGLDDASYSNQAYFFDMDQDGDLDMFLLNHPMDFRNKNKIMTGDQNMINFDYYASDKMYRNNGNGRFTDVTREAGILNRSWGLSACIGDFNQDGLPDIFVANDFLKPDNIYVNNGDGTFTDRAMEYLRHLSFSSMGSDFADFNNDGLDDLFVLDMAWSDPERAKRNVMYMSFMNFNTIKRRGYPYTYPENMLHMNLGNNSYAEIAQMAGVTQTGWSWSPLFTDLDNDGYKDLFVSNGILREIVDKDFLDKKTEYDKVTNPRERNYYRDLLMDIPEYDDHNYIFRNQGDLTFNDLSLPWGMGGPSNANGAAYADLDGDGDMDLVTNNLNEPSIIYENLADSRLSNNYLKVQLSGCPNNHFSIGTRVEIKSGDQIQVQDLNPIRGYMSSVEYVLNFGLGKSSSVESLVVTWPDGNKTEIEYPRINTLVEVQYSPPNFTDYTKPEKTTPLFKEITTVSKLSHMHSDIPYNDFQSEILLPHKLSENGPYLSVSDVNNDGLEDFYIGGSAGKEAALYLQDREGMFSNHPDKALGADSRYEDQGSVFFDADSDGDPDLYVVSGGNKLKDISMFQDRLYLNDGTGNFRLAEDALPDIHSSGSAVACADIDADGDLDLAVGGSVVPGQYPESPRSYLLENRDGKFIDVTHSIAPGLENPGMVTDLEFSDIDADGDPDLLVAGKWMPITLFRNDGGRYEKPGENIFSAGTAGWWFDLESGDIDNDGDLDFIAGNIGENNKYQPSAENSLHVYYNDFDNNGTGDIILAKDHEGLTYPVRCREYLIQQLPFIEEKFPDYESYGKARLEEILPEPGLSNALHYRANLFSSCILINDGSGNFEIHRLSSFAQMSPLTGICLVDVNSDNNLDIIAAGNLFGTEPGTIRYDAGSGVCMLGDGTGSFTSLPVGESGIFSPGNVKDLALIKLASGTTGVLVTNNNGYLQLYGKTE